jgi:plasmid maintenance system antidote protein VapI
MIISKMNLLSIKEVSEKLGVSARRINQLIDEKNCLLRKLVVNTS